MKTSHSIKGLILFFTFLQFLQAKDISYLLEVKKDTPLFKRPSTKSPKVADAEEGTLLLFVEKSTKGIWVKLRDSDGLEGWMPTNRTDYSEVNAARETNDQIQQISRLDKSERNIDKKQATKEEMMEEIMRQKREQVEAFNPRFRIAPLMRWSSDSEPASTRMGVRGDYNLGNLALSGQDRVGQAWGVVEATFPAPQVSSKSDFTLAARYATRAPIYGPLFYGVDFGYAVDNVKSQYRHHFSTGLSGGFQIGPFDLMTRAAYDFFCRSRYYIELQLGVAF